MKKELISVQVVLITTNLGIIACLIAWSRCSENQNATHFENLNPIKLNLSKCQILI
jgi:hypothetical protein